MSKAEHSNLTCSLLENENVCLKCLVMLANYTLLKDMNTLGHNQATVDTSRTNLDSNKIFFKKSCRACQAFLG